MLSSSRIRTTDFGRASLVGRPLLGAALPRVQVGLSLWYFARLGSEEPPDELTWTLECPRHSMYTNFAVCIRMPQKHLRSSSLQPANQPQARGGWFSASFWNRIRSCSPRVRSPLCGRQVWSDIRSTGLENRGSRETVSSLFGGVTRVQMKTIRCGPKPVKRNFGPFYRPQMALHSFFWAKPSQLG